MSMAGYVADRTDRDVLQTIQGFEEQRRPLRVSASEIAELMGCSILTVQRAISRLEKKGHLKISNQKGQPNCYEFPGRAID
jgi:Mn-dependent DtxR family transcriptional regulator